MFDRKVGTKQESRRRLRSGSIASCLERRLGVPQEQRRRRLYPAYRIKRQHQVKRSGSRLVRARAGLQICPLDIAVYIGKWLGGGRETHRGRAADSRLPFFERSLEVFDAHGAGVVERGGGQRVVGEAVDLARQSARALEQRFDGGGLEQRQLAAGQSQAVGEVVVEFVAVEPAEVVAHDEALVQGLVHGHGQAPAQFGQSHQHQAQPVFGVHGEVGEQSEVFEHVVSQVLGLVDDEHGRLFGFGHEAGDFVADGLKNKPKERVQQAPPVLVATSFESIGGRAFTVVIEESIGDAACQALGVSRATFYRRQRSTPGHRQPRPTPARALCESEREQVLDVLAGPRFVDRAPAEVVATLLDEGHYLCSERTMYRILAADQPVRERRNQREHPQYTKPELVATAPNQTRSWDTTKLLGPTKWTYFYLYVVLNIFSRYAVGWMVADRENSALAGRLIEESCHKQGVQPQVLTLHSDRGAPMTSKCTAQLLADLGVTRSLSRPQVSDDNPFSEAQFKTLKYHPGFPGRFHDITAAAPGTTLDACQPQSVK